MKPTMTLLQRAVILRLREAGRHDLAELAASAWPRGGQIAVFGEVKSVGLVADVARCNERRSAPNGAPPRTSM
jgi:hypothetical protein